MLTISGLGRIGRRAGPDVIVRPGAVCLLAPGMPHDYGVEPQLQRWAVAYSHFHARPEWHVLLDWPGPARGLGLLQIKGAVYDRVLDQLRTAAAYSASPQPRAKLFGMNALEAALLWCDTQNPRARPLDERILAAVEYIAAQFHTPIDINSLAAQANLSVSRFAHLFAEQLGVTPMRYVESQRLALARQLLSSTRRPIAAIARDCGYQDPLYFSSRFHREVGASPSAYRRGATEAAR